MEENFLYALMAMILPVGLARILLSRALNRLDPERQQALLASVAGMQKIRLILLGVLVVMLFVLPQTTTVLAPAYLLGMSFLYWKKIGATNPPKEYRHAFFASVLLGLTGVIVFLAIV